MQMEAASTAMKEGAKKWNIAINFKGVFFLRMEKSGYCTGRLYIK